MNTVFAFLPLAFLGNFQGWEWFIVFIVILLLFGGKKLPELARGAGKAIREFKRISNETEETFKKAMSEEEAEEAEKAARAKAAEQKPSTPAQPRAVPPIVSQTTGMPETPDAAVPPIMPKTDDEIAQDDEHSAR